MGLLVSLAVLGPNLLLLRFPPSVPMPTAEIPRPLAWTERAGQALCMVVPAITAAGELVWWWAAPVLAGLAGYYLLWGRYLRTGRRGDTLYRSAWGIPVPMAVLPVGVFLATAAWLSNPWVALAALVLGAGHIPAALLVSRPARTPAP